MRRPEERVKNTTPNQALSPDSCIIPRADSRPATRRSEGSNTAEMPDAHRRLECMAYATGQIAAGASWCFR